MRRPTLRQSSDRPTTRFISKDLNGIIQSVNSAAERMFGYRADELIGHNIRILIPPERQAEEDLILGRIRRGERVDHFETVRVAKDGRPDGHVAHGVAGARRRGSRDRRVEDCAQHHGAEARHRRTRSSPRGRARRPRGSRARQPREGRVSRDGVARAQDAPERHPVVDRADGARPRRSQDPRAWPRRRRTEHAPPGAAHLGPAGHQPHRRRQAATREPERRRRVDRVGRHRHGATRRGGKTDRDHDVARGRRADCRRPGAAAAGGVEPAVERGEVHPGGRPRLRDAARDSDPRDHYRDR